MFKTPRQLPPIHTLLDALDSRHPRDLARYLGVSERTVYGWLAADQCPRPAHLALFWVSPWGESIIHAEAHNGARWALARAADLEKENATLREQVAYMGRPAWAANDAIGWPAAPAPAPAYSAGRTFAPPRIRYRLGWQRPGY